MAYQPIGIEDNTPSYDILTGKMKSPIAPASVLSTRNPTQYNPVSDVNSINHGEQLGIGAAIPGYPSFDVWNQNMATNPTGGGFTPGTLGQGQGVTDSWYDMKGKGGMALGVAGIGLGALNSWMSWSALQQQKKFQNNQIALQKADFKNSANSYNRDVDAMIDNRHAFAGKTGQAAADDKARYMDQWGASTTIG